MMVRACVHGLFLKSNFALIWILCCFLWRKINDPPFVVCRFGGSWRSDMIIIIGYEPTRHIHRLKTTWTQYEIYRTVLTLNITHSLIHHLQQQPGPLNNSKHQISNYEQQSRRLLRYHNRWIPKGPNRNAALRRRRPSHSRELSLSLHGRKGTRTHRKTPTFQRKLLPPGYPGFHVPRRRFHQAQWDRRGEHLWR